MTNEPPVVADSAVLIGGHADGKRRKLSNPPAQFIQTMKLKAPRVTVAEPNEYEDIETEHYRIERIVADGRVFVVYVVKSMKIDEAMARLLAHYSPPKQNSIPQ